MSVALVTGANRGIGLQLCRLLVERGHEVIGTSRGAAPALEEVGARVENLDVSDEASIGALSSRLQRGPKIDLLINNAGILFREGLDELSPARIEQQFVVNALGPIRLTVALLPVLAEDAKVAMITSRMGSIEDNTSGGYYGYRMSKAALNAGSVSLAHDLRDRGNAVIILHPGYVQTDMTGGMGDVTPEVSASRLLERIEELDLKSTGTFRHANGETLPW